jgi:hypothetical protein
MKHDSHDQRAYTPQEIAQWIGRYRASGLSLGAFAQKHGLPKSRLHYWVYDKRYASLVQPEISVPTFQEVRLTAGLPGQQSWALEISLPAGPVARFSAGAAAAWIGAVVQALQRPC